MINIENCRKNEVKSKKYYLYKRRKTSNVFDIFNIVTYYKVMSLFIFFIHTGYPLYDLNYINFLFLKKGDYDQWGGSYRQLTP